MLDINFLIVFTLATAFIFVIHILAYLIVLMRQILMLDNKSLLIAIDDNVLLVMRKFNQMLLILVCIISILLSYLSFLYVFHKELFIWSYD